MSDTKNPVVKPTVKFLRPRALIIKIAELNTFELRKAVWETAQTTLKNQESIEGFSEIEEKKQQETIINLPK